MLVRRAFKFQLKPKPCHERKMAQFAGSCRFVWNKALGLQRELLEKGEMLLGYTELCTLLADWKGEEGTEFLGEVHSQPLQQCMKNLDRALKDAFDKKNRKRFPRFKKKGRHDSFRYPQGFKLDSENSRVYLPKIGWVRYRDSRKIEGTPKNVTVSRHLDRWYVSLQTEHEVSAPVHESTSMVGVDVGVVRFATLSDGTVYEPVSSFRKAEKRLKRVQRRLSRKVKGSKNFQKAKRAVGRVHAKIARVRQDFLHKVTTEVSKNHAAVVVEDLHVKNMSASAAGTKEQPGRNVRAKAGLNKSILDQGWYEFRRQLDYKQSWRGGMVVAVPPRNTSRTCPVCGHVAKENRTTQERFSCVSCGHKKNADLNAAENILAVGHTVLACGENVRLEAIRAVSVKQEPAEGLRVGNR